MNVIMSSLLCNVLWFVFVTGIGMVILTHLITV